MSASDDTTKAQPVQGSRVAMGRILGSKLIVALHRERHESISGTSTKRRPDDGPVSIRYIVTDIDAAIRFDTEHLGFDVTMHPGRDSPWSGEGTSVSC
jgi:hypothetical protein